MQIKKVKVGAELVLGMRRGRRFESRKAKINKYSCRKSKNTRFENKLV